MNYFKLTVGLLFISLVSTAQDEAINCSTGGYEVGGAVVRNQYFGDMHCSSPYASSGFNMSLQGFARRSINRFITLRGNLSIGQLAASDLDNPAKRWDYRRVRFKSPLVELSVQAEVFPMARKQTDVSSKQQRLAPYLFLGLGGAYTNPAVGGDPRVGNVLGYGAPDAATMREDAAQKKRLTPVLPIGLGVAVDLKPRVRVNVELGYRFTNSDYLDGFKLAAYQYSNHNDSYLMVSLGAAYRLGGTDADDDGVADRCDACPRLFGVPALRGCPDADNDGVIDPDDSCPDDFGDPATCGCPDDDQDGVPNDCDCCPNEKGERVYHGCAKPHSIEYQHKRVANLMRYCPLCPPDLPNASRDRKSNSSMLKVLKAR